MASGNLFLGSAYKSVGDVTMYVRNGKQVSRVRRRTVANPRTGLQLAQRCILKTVSTAYSVLAPICCQSFQGKQSRSMNQARFQKVNLNMLRTKAAAAVGGEGMTEAGVYENETGNFVGKQTMGAALNPYVVSEGSLQFDNKYDVNNSSFLYFNTDLPVATVTYRQFIDMLGVQPGDQLTFLVLLTNTLLVGGGFPDAGLISDFLYCRVILMPSDGDLSSPLFASSGSGYIINKPNSRNEGSIMFVEHSGFSVTSINGVPWVVDQDERSCLGAAGIILSRKADSGWLYSSCRLRALGVIGDDIKLDDYLPLNAAIASFESSQDSSRYLDQAHRVG